jgi:hypothetical protein
MDCSQCGQPMRRTDRDTTTGRDIRAYKCDGCGFEDREDTGKAFWQALSEYNEEYQAEQTKRTRAERRAARPLPPEPPPKLPFEPMREATFEHARELPQEPMRKPPFAPMRENPQAPASERRGLFGGLFRRRK